MIHENDFYTNQYKCITLGAISFHISEHKIANYFD